MVVGDGPDSVCEGGAGFRSGGDCTPFSNEKGPQRPSSWPAIASLPDLPACPEGPRSLVVSAMGSSEGAKTARDGRREADEGVPGHGSLAAAISLGELLPRSADLHAFLENDSPPVTEDWSPRTVSSFGSIESHQAGGDGTDISTATTTPEASVCGDEAVLPGVATPSQQHSSNPPASPSEHRREPRARRPQLHPSLNEAVQGHHQYGTPEMARGSAKHPHLPPSELQPRLVAPGQGYPKHLPRAEKLPMSGYELLAAKLSTSTPWAMRRGSGSSSWSDDGPAIKPIYRRFEALNHRVLLHLQDELTELEEQLHRLDTADTQTRRLQNCILPASRRAEAMAGGELQWRKTDVLAKIGLKLAHFSLFPSSPSPTNISLTTSATASP